MCSEGSLGEPGLTWRWKDEDNAIAQKLSNVAIKSCCTPHSVTGRNTAEFVMKKAIVNQVDLVKTQFGASSSA